MSTNKTWGPRDIQDPSLRRMAEANRIPLIHAVHLDLQNRISDVGLIALLTADDPETVTHARQYMADRVQLMKPWLILCCSFGTGKSQAAAWVLWQEYRQQVEDAKKLRDPEFLDLYTSDQWPGPTGLFVGLQDLVLAEPWGKDIQDWCSRTSTVVLDDVGDSATASKVETIACARYDSLLPLVLTTNLTFEAFKFQMPRVADRAVQVGLVAEVFGPSFRGQP